MQKLKILTCLLGMTLVLGCGTTQTTTQSMTKNNSINEPIITSEPTKEITPTNTPEPTPIERDDTISISMVGDNLIHSGLYKGAKQDDGSYDFSSLFKNVKQDIEESDISIINQETIFVTDYSLISSYPCFGTPAEMGKYIVNAGFDIVACATNHTYDKRESGIRQTMDYWDTNYPEITYVGIHKDEEDANTIKTYDCKGVKFALVNYTYGLNGFTLPNDKPYLVDLLDNQEKYVNDLHKAEEIGDMTICILHAGNEYVYSPADYQKNMIEIAIDNGADIVFCSHPHVLEPYEMVETKNGNEGLVYYSLGNFVSAQDEVPRLLGGLAKVNLNVHYVDDKVSSIEIGDYDLVPLVTHYDYNNYYTTYKLSDYTNELAAQHKIRRKSSNFSVETLNELFNKIIGE